jgi:hypothetical protein
MQTAVTTAAIALAAADVPNGSGRIVPGSGCRF